MKINNIFLRAFLGLLFAFSGVYASAQATSHKDFQPYLQLISSSDQGGHTSYVYRLQGDQNEISNNSQWLENMLYDTQVYSSVTVDKTSQTCTITTAGISGSERATSIQSDLNAQLRAYNHLPASAEEQKLQDTFQANTRNARSTSNTVSADEQKLKDEHAKNVSNNNSSR
jgi:hypothetical protein